MGLGPPDASAYYTTLTSSLPVVTCSHSRSDASAAPTPAARTIDRCAGSVNHAAARSSARGRRWDAESFLQLGGSQIVEEALPRGVEHVPRQNQRSGCSRCRISSRTSDPVRRPDTLTPSPKKRLRTGTTSRCAPTRRFSSATSRHSKGQSACRTVAPPSRQSAAHAPSRAGAAPVFHQVTRHPDTVLILREAVVAARRGKAAGRKEDTARRRDRQKTRPTADEALAASARSAVRQRWPPARRTDEADRPRYGSASIPRHHAHRLHRRVQLGQIADGAVKWGPSFRPGREPPAYGANLQRCQPA